MGENQQRLDELLRRRRRAALVPKTVEAWAALGVVASPLSAIRQEALVTRLRTSGLRRSGVLPEASSTSLSQHIRDFVEPNDLLVICGWDVDEEPAVLIPAAAINRCVSHLRSLYPDGFLLLDQPATSALVIDFDEVHPSAIYVDHVWFPSRK
ncbi:hypothetical protein GS397_18495 [Sphingobium yanoikuyae]|uniref:Uncharacterized protein n=1 Tax=Sphingobium yanoikuyae TaxID=13690 RepID=A0A6P1GKU4_SPHYA|nr:hypothetical protein [Sphingobium yanoikuyae]QHD68854.1 hypothetical protein GS397_18495 [Sphingobium yanoikuyae]